MKWMGTRMRWGVFHSRRFIPEEVMIGAYVGIIAMFVISGTGFFVSYLARGSRDSESAKTIATASGIIFITGAVFTVVSVMLNRSRNSYLDWLKRHLKLLRYSVYMEPGNETPNVSPESVLNSWVRVPVSLERKVLLINAGITARHAMSRDTRMLMNEDLLIMAGLRRVRTV